MGVCWCSCNVWNYFEGGSWQRQRQFITNSNSHNSYPQQAKAMLSYISKKVYPTVFGTKRPTSSKFYDVQEGGCDLFHTLQKISTLQKRIEEVNSTADFQVNDTIEQSLKMFFIYHSNAIEGSQLSLGDTISFLQDEIIYEENSARDHMDALGHAAAIVLSNSALRSGDKINHQFVCEMNDLLTSHITDSKNQEPIHSGTYKVHTNSSHQVDGPVHEYVEPEQVSAEMEELFRFCEDNKKQSMHPVVKTAIAHYNFVRIHPFQHGNGRGARVLMNLILQSYGLPPAVIQLGDKDRYLRCLQSADHGDINPFIRLVAHSLLETMELVLDTYHNEYNAAQQIIRS